ncbi:MAG: alpha-ketoglutarate-dependent dioxygenase AlkB [Robiginitomaculum sp.]
MLIKLPNGFTYKPEYFNRKMQEELLGYVSAAARGVAPFYQPTMPCTGQPLSVVMSNFGPLGWVTDKEGGYRYEPTHPKTGKSWPAMPQALLNLWDVLTGYPALPEACLINWYREGSKMGMHVDLDEFDLNAPVVSVSLGDPARYRLGGQKRGGKTHNLKLSSGDVVVLAGDARRCYHGVDKIFYGQSTLVPKGGRINLTMRRVNKP